MSSQIDDNKVKEGNVVRMWNTERPRFSNENKMYYFIWVQDGCVELPMATTAKELTDAMERGVKYKSTFLMDNLKLGHVTSLFGYRVVLVNYDGVDKLLVFTGSKYTNAKIRASKNIEDIPRKGFLTDLMD